MEQSTREHLIQGRTVTMPVRIRDAGAAVAMYSVPATAAQKVIDYSGLTVLQYRPGRAICSVLFVDYRDGDLDRYHEFGIGFLVRRPGGRGGMRDLLRGQAGVYIHRLPVDQLFTLEAGRGIWGFPKVMSDIAISHGVRRTGASLRINGDLIADLTVRGGVPVPGGGMATSLDAYTNMDGVLRRVPWKMTASGTRTRPGGGDLVLGEHPWSAELRAMGLPKRALFSSTIDHLQMTFEGAEEVR